MNKSAPKVLNDIVKALSKASLSAVRDDTDGRIDSKKDEAVIIEWLKLQPKFKNRIEEGKLRAFGDMWVKDYDNTWHVVNIKTSFGGQDNAWSKLGFIWAFTNLTLDQYKEMGIPNKVTDKKFAKIILENKKETARDYWFLSLNKNDFSHVMIRGAKQINFWRTNPTNNMQVKWREEYQTAPSTRTFDEAFHTIIIDGVFKCWAEKASHWADAIAHRATIVNAPVAKSKKKSKARS